MDASMFRQRSDYYNHVVVPLAKTWWTLTHDLRDGGLTLTELDERHVNGLEALSLTAFAADVGVEQDGDRVHIERAFTPAELAEAIPTLGGMFKLTIPKVGRFVLSTQGMPFWVGVVKKVNNSYSNDKTFDAVLGLSMGAREVDLRPHGVSRENEVVDTTMATVHLSERGFAATPLVPAMLRLMKWDDVIEMLLASKREPTDVWNWKFRVHLAADGTSIHAEWFKNERGY